MESDQSDPTTPSRHRYPPGKQARARQPVFRQEEVWTGGWTADRDTVSTAHVYRKSRNLGTKGLDDVQRDEAQRMG